MCFSIQTFLKQQTPCSATCFSGPQTTHCFSVRPFVIFLVILPCRVFFPPLIKKQKQNSSDMCRIRKINDKWDHWCWFGCHEGIYCETAASVPLPQTPTCLTFMASDALWLPLERYFWLFCYSISITKHFLSYSDTHINWNSHLYPFLCWRTIIYFIPLNRI